MGMGWGAGGCWCGLQVRILEVVIVSHEISLEYVRYDDRFRFGRM